MTLEGYISRVHTSQIAGRNQPVAVVRFCNVWPEEEDSLEILQSALFRLIKKLSVKLLCALDLSFFFRTPAVNSFRFLSYYLFTVDTCVHIIAHASSVPGVVVLH